MVHHSSPSLKTSFTRCKHSAADIKQWQDSSSEYHDCHHPLESNAGSASNRTNQRMRTEPKTRLTKQIGQIKLFGQLFGHDRCHVLTSIFLLHTI